MAAVILPFMDWGARADDAGEEFDDEAPDADISPAVDPNLTAAE